ncbi:unnamed protein product [Pedinophyceae sp. YPF-701]|nr:unnamed protein product [Pedinophyceae sp. YPF-701]
MRKERAMRGPRGLMADRKILTLPIDTAKVRLQLQKGGAAEAKYKGMFGTMATVAKDEGPAALWKGLVPGLHRQCLFGGLRIGMYDPVKRFYMGDMPADAAPPLHLKIAAGLTTGGLGILIANPTDLVKVRMQAQAKLPEGVAPKYPSAVSAYRIIAQEEGLLGLWRGVGPNVGRNSVINAAEMATYDQFKEFFLSMGMADGVGCHVLSALGAGFVAVSVGSPVDVVKSRMMGSSEYTGVLDCFAKTLKNDGLSGFYRGFLPNFGRLGSWNVAMFMTLEAVRARMSA